MNALYSGPGSSDTKLDNTSLICKIELGRSTVVVSSEKVVSDIVR